MTEFTAWKRRAVVLVVCAATAVVSPAQTFTMLLDFDGSNGAYPNDMSLIQGADGSLYGTTTFGGTNSGGTVFKINAAGALTTLYNFCGLPGCHDGQYPQGGLVLGIDGNFYGTTSQGGNDACDGSYGCGTFFRMTPEGTLTTLHIFCVEVNCNDGAEPVGGLTQVIDGNIYGTTVYGDVSGCGTIFKVTPSGTFATVLRFSNGQTDDGCQPFGGLIQATDGELFGTTNTSGLNHYGTVFRADLDGTLTTLYNFCSQRGCSDGKNPKSGLVQTTDGNFFGTTVGGNAVGEMGTVYKITAGGRLTILHIFCATNFSCGPDGYEPLAALVQGTDGYLYGTTLRGGTIGAGTVFRITTGGTLTTLYNFNNLDGGEVTGAMLQATDGNFYGTTSGHGIGPEGTVFRLNMGLAPFVTFVLAAGKIGQTGGILGQGFTGTTAVSLNGVPANFAVVSDTFIDATIPEGATTGYVTVTTPSGVLTSNVPFHVLP